MELDVDREIKSLTRFTGNESVEEETSIYSKGGASIGRELKKDTL